MGEVVTFGEAMIRLSPPDFMRLEQTPTLEVRVGGGELNVAVGVSRLGLPSAWVSRLPDNPLGRMIRNKAREHGVCTDHIVWTKDSRAGLYFVEFGSAPRASSVLYDRGCSAISEVKPGEIDWEKVFARASWYHVSGITPALSASVAEVTRESLEAAKRARVQISYDLNYRSKLWTPEQARSCQEPMMSLVDVLITTEEDTRLVLGIAATGHGDENFASVSAEPYKEVAHKLADRFGFKAVAITLRENPSVLRNTWTAIVYAGGNLYQDRKYDLELVDRLGGGDSFSAGLIYGWLTHSDWQTALRYAVCFSALKQSHPGDFNWTTRSEVEAQLNSASLRVAR